ncbi:1-acyl-sn-glycerol-3-phosphate acyltransferase [Patescibacteria group bacterium]|nr:1-acyl-sn-glycerol-3-phosphate acyltransferase [Patescibacteria group bacterium]
MKKLNYYGPLFLQKVGYLVFLFLYKVFLNIEIKGKENLKDLKGPIIIAPNHTSELDVTAMPLLFPFFSSLYPIYFVANSRAKFMGFGWRKYVYGEAFFNMLGGYSTNSGHRDYVVSLEDHIKLLSNKHTICIFPEGRRTLDGNLGPARGGMGYMAFTSRATVVPVAIDTFFNISPWDLFMRKRKVVITVLKPVTTEEIFQTNNPEVVDFQHASEMILERISSVLQ